MIAVDMEPYSIVENAGFKRFVAGLQPKYEIPSREYVTRTGIPRMYEAVRKTIAASMESAGKVSFTTDMWTCDHTNRAFVSLTAHWITVSFERKMAILQVQGFTEAHTADKIRAAIEGMLSDWELTSRVGQLPL